MVAQPHSITLDDLRAESAGCRACDLWKDATQTVFGEGAPAAPIVMVGEQPGDQEDRVGKPFVGPAGRVLSDGLEAAGIAPGDVYITNVVKHFKWRPAGKRRIHQRPDQEEVQACRPWLDAELERVRPRVLVCLGATAAQALLGRSFRVTKQRGEVLEGLQLAPAVVATVHPSSILRQPDSESRRIAMAEFVRDLQAVAAAAQARQ